MKDKELREYMVTFISEIRCTNKNFSEKLDRLMKYLNLEEVTTPEETKIVLKAKK